MIADLLISLAITVVIFGVLWLIFFGFGLPK